MPVIVIAAAFVMSQSLYDLAYPGIGTWTNAVASWQHYLLVGVHTVSLCEVRVHLGSLLSVQEMFSHTLLWPASLVHFLIKFLK